MAPNGVKRKAKNSPADNPAQKKLKAYFSPQISVPCKQDLSTGDILQGPSRVALSVEQTKVLRMVVDEEKSLYFTGAAGTGKSLLLRTIIRDLRKKYSKEKDAVAVTASTGMASSNIGGMTIHSWGAVTPNSQNLDSVVKCIRTCKPALQRWKKAKVLIIDEVSMVDGHLFEQLSSIAVKLRKKTDKPFGGLQLVVTGDFFQLPPVTKNNQVPFFAFEAPAWTDTLQHTINLTQVFRQKDSRFVAALNTLRDGAPSEESTALFTSLSRPLPQSTILPTELFSTRAQVAKSNEGRLAALPSQLLTYIASDSGTKPRLLEHLLAEQKLELKIDAQVMLIKNVDDVLVNGVVGKVVGFYRPMELVGNSSSSISLGSRSPAGTTETKKNGALLRHVLLQDDGRTPVDPQEADKENEMKEEAKAKAKSKRGPDSDERYPLVVFEFPLQDGSGRTGTEAVLIKRDEFRVEDSEGKVLARRLQLPLILAWAMSIHKSQGQTIHRVKVDLSRVFEHGQSYVALSRASSLDGLQVIGFKPKKVMAHPKVIEWSKTLQQVSTGEEDAS